MKRLFLLVFLPFFTVLFVSAQDIPVKQEERNSYSFKVPEFITVTNFEFISAVTTDQPDNYFINLRALDAAGKQDNSIQGKLLFEINGVTKPVAFENGLGSVKATITGTDKITMRAVDSDITRVGTIQHPFNWSKILGLTLAVAVLAIIIWAIQKRRKPTPENGPVPS